MPVRERRIAALVVTRLQHAGDAIEVVQEVVIELTVGVVPQLEIGAHARLVKVEHFHRLFHVRLENVHRAADELA